jgi:hypothetical protein
MTRMLAIRGVASHEEASQWLRTGWEDVAESLQPKYRGGDFTYLAVRTDRGNLAIVELSGKQVSQVTLCWSLASFGKTRHG